MVLLNLATANWLLAIDTFSGGVQTLKNPNDPLGTNFVIDAQTKPDWNITDSRWLGDIILCDRPAGSNTGCTTRVSGLSADIRKVTQSGNTIMVNYTGNSANANGFKGYNVLESWTANNDVLQWTTTVVNTSPNDIEFQDVGFPLLMDSYWKKEQTSIYEQNVGRHSYIGEDGSYIWWGRPNGVTPFLLMTMGNGTSLEFKNKAEGGEGPFGADDPTWEGLQEFYVHSANVAPARSSASGSYLPATSVTVPTGKSVSFTFNFRWPSSYANMHDALYNAGAIDHISYPGMTVPTDTTVTLAVRAKGGIQSVVGESGKNVQVTSLGVKNTYNLYSFKLPSVGPNKITVTFNGGRTSVMQYNSISPVSQLISSRASFIANKQQAKTSRSYNGAFLQYDLIQKQLITWDDYPGGGWKEWMAGGSDDLGLSPAEFLSEKNTRIPVQSEITAVDTWIEKFILGFLQSAKTNGVRNWQVYRWYDGQDGTPIDTGTWRSYNYIHVANTYFNMYRIKKNYPSATTSRKATEYLQFCYNTLNALYTTYGANNLGLMGESTYPEILSALRAENMGTQANTLDGFFRQKYDLLAAEKYPFASEITIDTTGFETCFTLGKLYGNPDLLTKVQLASLKARGNSPAWYWYGGDDRSMGESWWNLGYETQIGAWVQQEFLLNNGTNPDADALRSTYGAYMAGWSNINSGQISGDPDVNGAASWIYQSQLGTNEYGYIGLANGWWTWSGEADLGFWGGLRTASVAVVNDPVIGRYAYNGLVSDAGSGAIQITPNDGVSQRIVLWNLGNLDIKISNGQYTKAVISASPVNSISLTLNPPSMKSVNTIVSIDRLPAGGWNILVGGRKVGTFNSDGKSAVATFAAITAANTAVKFTKQ